jgi:hypothetical protein
MSGLLYASKCDWFQGNVLDYIGFAPSRFYLRESCKGLSNSIPKEIQVSLEEFGLALDRKLVNPKLMLLMPTTGQKPSDMRPLLRAYGKIKNGRLRVMILERTLVYLDDSFLMEISNSIADIDWDTWMDGSIMLIAKIETIKRLIAEKTGKWPSRTLSRCVWK